MKRKNGSAARVYNKSLQLIDRSLTDTEAAAEHFFMLPKLFRNGLVHLLVLVFSLYHDHHSRPGTSTGHRISEVKWSASVRVSRQKNEHLPKCEG